MLPKTKTLKNGTATVIRHLSKEDLDDIWSIFNVIVQEKRYIPVVNPVTSRFEKENWYYRQRDENNIVIVSEIGGKVVGQCMIEHTGWDAADHVGELGIIIAPKFRNLGLGRILIQEAIDVASENKFEKVCLSCFHTNLRALNLYQQLGFQRVGYRAKQYKLDGTFYDEILMELWIEDFTCEE